MSVVVETTLGDITVDLFIKDRPRASLNFLKLCKTKYYNYNLFHTISRGFIAQTGDPTGSRNGGESIHGVLEGPLKRYFEAEKTPRIKHTTMGLISFVGTEEQMLGSQFFFTLGSDLTYLDEQHCVFGEVVEGLDVLDLLNEAICDQDNRPYQDVRITHTVVLDDPFPDPKSLIIPARSPSPSAERLQGGRIAPDEDIDETQGKSMQEINEIIADKEAKARAAILEMIGDIPDADMAPPENVLFVCKLNPVTTDDDLEIIFSRFGKIKSCEVIRDKKNGESLQYAFVEFEDEKSCEVAYFKMDNVLIDDRRIHVDFSQSVAKIKWHGKGRGVTTYDDKGRMTNDRKNDFGNGRYEKNHEQKDKRGNFNERSSDQPERNNRYHNRKQESRSIRRSRSNSRGRQKDTRRDTERYQSSKQRNSSRDKYASSKPNRRGNNRERSRSKSRNNESRRRNEEKPQRKEDNYQKRRSRSRSRNDDRKKSYSVGRHQERRHEVRVEQRQSRVEHSRRDVKRRSTSRSPKQDSRKGKETKRHDVTDEAKNRKDKKKKKQESESSEESDSSSDSSSSEESSSDDRHKKKKKSSKKVPKKAKNKKKRSRSSS